MKEMCTEKLKYTKKYNKIRAELLVNRSGQKEPAEMIKVSAVNNKTSLETDTSPYLNIAKEILDQQVKIWLGFAYDAGKITG